MNIPNDGGWGKPAAPAGLPAAGQGSGLPVRLWTLPGKWVFQGLLLLTASLSFGTGLLAVRENQTPKDPLWIEQLPPEELPGSISTSTAAAVVQAVEQGSVAPQTAKQLPPVLPSPSTPKPQSGQYVGSKTGTKYYLTSCATAKRIKDENKVWFATKQQAEAAGYAPASNCKGL